MEAYLTVRAYVIVKGYIDAKDERGNSMYGTLLALASRRETKYLSVMFSYDETIKSMSWDELLHLHRNKENERDRSPMMVRQEEELFKFLAQGNTINNVAKNRNTKQAEQSISRYCLGNLKLKAVSLIEYIEAAESDMAKFDQETESAEDQSKDESNRHEPQADSPESEEHEEEKPDEPKAKDEIVVRCEPVLAPVGGVAMNELNIGDMIMVQLPGDSVFFKLLSRNINGFDGVVSAGVTGILQNELGTATVSVSLSEGITGVIKLSGKVRVKTAQTSKEQGKKAGVSEISTNIVLGVAAAIVIIAALAVLYYIFGW